MKKITLFRFALLGTFLLFFLSAARVQASEIKSVAALTNKILLVHFDDGFVAYPNSVTKTELDKLAASDINSYLISSVDDPNYTSTLAPISVGRKSKGKQFKQSPSTWDFGKNAFNPTSKADWVEEHFVFIELPHPMENGAIYSINTGDLATNGDNWDFTYNYKTSRSEAIHVNTIGYNPSAPKYGYVYYWMGDKGGLELSSMAGSAFEVYEVSDLDNPVTTGTLNFRKASDNIETGQLNDTPDQNFLGADVYECDFSEISAEGTYRLVVDGIGCSFDFKIGEDALWEPYYHAIRGLYYNRSGIRLDAPYTEEGYYRPVNQNTKVVDAEHSNPKFQGASFAGKLVYSEYPYMDWDNKDGGGSSVQAIRDAADGNIIDVAGWYHDAADWDSYATHHKIPALLLLTYEYFPELFGDDELNIPESGNGIPDIVDEASWLIKFNYRLRKELIEKGFSDGGVGGARICADVFDKVDYPGAENTFTSWTEPRRTVVTQVDAFMTYFYAGQAAHFAYVVKSLGKDPENWPVEMLDAISFEDMTYDNVDWIREAEEAFAWAQREDNQPSSNNNYDAELFAYRAYAAANLYRITNDEKYNRIAIEDLSKISSASHLKMDEQWGLYSYLKVSNYLVDKELKNSLKGVALSNAEFYGMAAAGKRACRWGGVFDFPMLVGQGTTPWMFETIMAYGLTGDTKYKDVVHTTADYFLGTNALNTTWMVNVGPKGFEEAFHLDSRNTGSWKVYTGWIVYGPWAMPYTGNLVEWEIDGLIKKGGAGAWNEQWQNFSAYPIMEDWPGHERYFNNIHAPMTAENTVHQQSVHAGISYGFVNGRSYYNAGSPSPISSISLNEESITFNLKRDTRKLYATIDNDKATFSQLKWSSSDESVAHVDGFGVVTAVGNGSADIICSALDESVMAVVSVVCENLTDIPVESITVTPTEVSLNEGETQVLSVLVMPDNAGITSYSWMSEDSSIADVVDNVLIAKSEGVVDVFCESDENPSIKGKVTVTVLAPDFFVVADFDNVVPVTDAPNANSAQSFAPGSIQYVDAANPSMDLVNSSEFVMQVDVPAGAWKLLGMVFPTGITFRACEYSKLRFKFYGAGINELWTQIVTEDDVVLADITPVFVAKDEWQTMSIDIPSTADGDIYSFKIFVNKATGEEAYSAYFDDFELVVDNNADCEPVVPVTSDVILDFEAYELDWNPYGAFAWAGTVAKTINPSTDNDNLSDNVLVYNRDGTSTSGGFGVVFPDELNFVGKWDNLSFQFYSTQTFNNLSVQPGWENASDNTDKIETSINFLDQNFSAHQWHTISFSMSDLNVKDAKVFDKFDRISIIPGLNEPGIFNFYMDNLQFVGLPTGMESGTNFSETVKVYPNPASSLLYVESQKLIKGIQVFNVSGEIVLTTIHLDDRIVKLNVANLPAGLYILNIVGESSTVNRKLVINK